MRRNRGGLASCDAATAAAGALGRRRRCAVKLAEGSALRDHVFEQIRKGWSPQQISGRLKTMPDNDNSLAKSRKRPSTKPSMCCRAVKSASKSLACCTRSASGGDRALPKTGAAG